MYRFFLIIFLNSFLSFSQIGIGTAKIASDAAFEIKSINKGFLPSRLTTAQRDAIVSPSIGLTIYNTTVNCLEWYNGVIWYNGCAKDEVAHFEITNCNKTSKGDMIQGTQVSGVSQIVSVTVTKIGSYNISATANGVTFAASGIFNVTGIQDVEVLASGTPVADGVHSFILNTDTKCSFDRKTDFEGDPAVVSSYICGTGSTGTMVKGRTISGVSQTITAVVSKTGRYNISSSLNGVIFSASGNFTATGSQTVELIATGKPIEAGTNYFVLGNCTFRRQTLDIATVSSYTCSTSSAGTMIKGRNVEGGVTQTITVNVTNQGVYDIVARANGVTFSKSGNFERQGSQNLVLDATGIPTSVGENEFVLNTSPNCSFKRSTVDSATITDVDCSTNSRGMMSAGIPISYYHVVTQNVMVNVAKIGAYDIRCTANGVTFSKTVTFTSLGQQNVELMASGTPLAEGTHTFTLNTAPNCSFTRETGSGNYTLIQRTQYVNESHGRSIKGQPSNGVSQQLYVNVTKTGPYNIVICNNGITFSASGTFSKTGTVIVVVFASGVPKETGTYTYGSFNFTTYDK